ncbi:hypothetical protein BBJ28_00008784 [Nothophytophthora sp. Chile5]|nr:hypothetical protein BBJ28_00008784 [Nothophytophthora sp. Chile5]
MVKVLHRQSGVCLFTHQWKWDPQAHAEGVDALVLSFTQFAREIDGGGTHSASEELPTSDCASDMAYSEEGLIATMVVGDVANGDSWWGICVTLIVLWRLQSSTGGLTMISFQNEAIQAVLFHDRTSDAASVALKLFLQRILQRFAQIFQQELQELQPQLQPSATPSAAEREAVEAPFRRFEAELDCQLLDDSLPIQIS